MSTDSDRDQEETSGKEGDYDPDKPSWAAAAAPSESSSLLDSSPFEHDDSFPDPKKDAKKDPKKKKGRKKGGGRKEKDRDSERAEEGRSNSNSNYPTDSGDDGDWSDGSGSTTASARRSPLQKPHRTALHNFFLSLSAAATLASVLLLVSLSASLIRSLPEMTLVQTSIRLYSACFAVLAVLAEWELPGGRALGGSWIMKGFFYVYLGIVEEEELTDGTDGTGGRSPPGGALTVTFYHVVNLVVIGIGAAYVVLGAFCCRKALERRREAYEGRVRRWKIRVRMREGEKNKE